MSHPTAEVLVRYAEGHLTAGDADDVRRHLDTCAACRAQHAAVTDFARRLDEHWLSAAVGELVREASGCPTVDEIGRYVGGERTDSIAAHLDACGRCQTIVADIEATTRVLERNGPLAPAGDASARRWSRSAGRALRAAAVVVAFLAGAAIGISLAPRPTLTDIPRIAKPPTPATPPSTLGLAPSVKPEAEAAFREALTLYDAPDFAARAIPKLQDAVRADPQFDLAWFWLGIAHLLRGDAESAVRPLVSATTLAPANLTYKEYLVWAYLASGAADKALAVQGDIVERRARTDAKR